VVGSVFYATPAKALHNNATASEVNIVSDAAVHSGLCFRVCTSFSSAIGDVNSFILALERSLTNDVPHVLTVPSPSFASPRYFTTLHPYRNTFHRPKSLTPLHSNTDEPSSLRSPPRPIPTDRLNHQPLFPQLPHRIRIQLPFDTQYQRSLLPGTSDGALGYRKEYISLCGEER
jgi:hypothetical protein